MENEARTRQSQYTHRPRGGNVSEEPFPKALHAFALSRGYKTQTAFAKSLGKKSNDIVSYWFRGKHVPSPEEMSIILLLHHPTPEEVDSLIPPWGDLLINGKGKIGGFRGSVSSFKRRIAARKSTSDPLAEWIHEFTLNSRITIKEFFEKIGQHARTEKKRIGLPTMQNILESADGLGLDEEQKEKLADAISKKIEQRISEGHRLSAAKVGRSLGKQQEGLTCTTYTPNQAAEKIDVTREAVRKRREKLGLPLIMDEGQFEILKESFEESREHREKIRRGQEASKNKIK